MPYGSISAVGTSNSGWAVIRTASVGAGTANLLNNLPAYLVLERAIPPGNTEQLLNLLIGVNAGPLVPLWGSAQFAFGQRIAALGCLGSVARRVSPPVGTAGAPLRGL